MVPIRILIVDGHPEVLLRIGTRLAHESQFELVGQISSADEAVETAKKANPEIVLIDPIMQDGSGMRAIRELKKQMPTVSIVALTAFVDTAMRLELEKAGVCSILLKNIDPGFLVKTLTEIRASQDTKNNIV